MGLNICIEDLNGNSHPTWDFYRMAGDRDVLDVLRDVGESWHDLGHHEYLYRPKDVDIFVDALLSRINVNYDRWRQLGEILKDDRWWMRFSI